jgi:hypothetical protein
MQVRTQQYEIRRERSGWRHPQERGGAMKHSSGANTRSWMSSTTDERARSIEPLVPNPRLVVDDAGERGMRLGAEKL